MTEKNIKIHEVLTYKKIIDKCKNILPLLKKLEFTFIRPNLVVDDWDDVKLNSYKETYESFKYGMGYIYNFPSSLASIPTWNISIYDLDIDNDKVIETIMYGERIQRGTYERDYNLDLDSWVLRPGYNVFELKKGEVPRGVSISGDPQRIPTERDRILSAVVSINNILSVLEVSDVIRSNVRHDTNVVLTFLGEQETKRGSGFDSHECTYRY